MEHAAGRYSRRRFLTGLAGGLAGAALVKGGWASQRPAAAAAAEGHLAWVWQFSDDGPRDAIRHVLARNRLGIVLKTHDGTSWMARWDQSPDAIKGPSDIRSLARYFETNGVPFHAWCVVTGEDPRGEAEMCAAALANGARSIFLDLEPPEDGNYWQGGPDEAVEFGRELRRLAPSARLAVAPDPRPWRIDAVPLAEFARFCDVIAPQAYWRTFSSEANYRLLREHGYETGDEGISPELILDVSAASLARFGRPLQPIGQGAAGPEAWQRFVRHAARHGMTQVSVWRYGTVGEHVWPLLGKQAQAPAGAPLTVNPGTGGAAGSDDRLRLTRTDLMGARGAWSQKLPGGQP